MATTPPTTSAGPADAGPADTGPTDTGPADAGPTTATPTSGSRSSMYGAARDRTLLTRRAAGVQIGVSLAAAGAGLACYLVFAPHVDRLVRVELGQVRPTDPSALRDALLPDLGLIAGYGIALVLLSRLAISMAWTLTSRRLAQVGLLCSVAAVVADLFEDLFLFLSKDSGWAYAAAGGASALKWSAVVPAGVTAGIGLLLAGARLWGNRNSKLESLQAGLPIDACLPAAPLEPPPEDNIPLSPAPGSVRWRNGFRVPDSHNAATDPDKESVAVCLSGGGIRSASVALGALQAMRSVLSEADFVVSVSGGGFTAGAIAQALTRAEPEAAPERGRLVRTMQSLRPAPPKRSEVSPDRRPEHVLAPGSALEDHIRRHASYLANTASKLLTALVLFARGLLGSLFLLFGMAIVVGIALANFYKHVPISGLSNFAAARRATHKHVVFGPLHAPTLWTLLGLAVLALAAWVLAVVIANVGDWNAPTCRSLRGASTAAASVAVALATFVVVVPALTWVVCWLYVHGLHGHPVTIGGPIAVVLLSYFAAIKSVFWKNKKKLMAAAKSSGGSGAPASVIELLIVAVLLILIGATWLMLLGISAATRPDGRAALVAALVCASWIFVGGLVDETVLSLHPFYRARLARAFAVRVKNGVAVPYPVEERTRLDEYAVIDPMKEGRPAPKFVFAAAANLVDDDRTAPGLRAVSYVMSADYLGGPDIGWVPTDKTIELCPPHLQRDLTVQAAVAISGAAFASAMGRASSWYGTLLAVSGARLGSWLPHPDYLLLRRELADSGDWTLPGIPHVRRFPYLLREVLGVHPYFQRLLNVTDGGHYENLGLVEALRRRCRLVYVIDASGDGPPTATTFAEAIRLAHDELGVVVKPRQPLDLVAGSGKRLAPDAPLSALNDRLSKSPVIIADVTFPPESGLPQGQRTGHVIFAKAVLWPQLPYEVLAYAARDPLFPHDSTADQWFDEGKFSSYKQLGWELGTAAKAAAGVFTHNGHRTVFRRRSAMHARPVDELLGPAVQGAALEQVEVEVEPLVEDRVGAGAAGDHRENGHLDPVDEAGGQ
jgi:hypothetical protein